jgi:hypothetical protein
MKLVLVETHAGSSPNGPVSQLSVAQSQRANCTGKKVATVAASNLHNDRLRNVLGLIFATDLDVIASVGPMHVIRVMMAVSQLIIWAELDRQGIYEPVTMGFFVSVAKQGRLPQAAMRRCL